MVPDLAVCGCAFSRQEFNGVICVRDLALCGSQCLLPREDCGGVGPVGLWAMVGAPSMMSLMLCKLLDLAIDPVGLGAIGLAPSS